MYIDELDNYGYISSISKMFLNFKRQYNNMAKEYTVIIEQGEDGYLIASVVELPGCHTQAKTMEELLSRIKEAISLYLEVEKDIEPTRFVGIQKVEVIA